MAAQESPEKLERRIRSLSKTVTAFGARTESYLKLMSAIKGLSAIPITAEDLDSAAGQVLEVLVRNLSGLDRCSILLFEEERGLLTLRAAMGQADLLEQPTGPYNRDLTFAPGEGIAGQVFESGEPRFWNQEPEAEVPQAGEKVGPAPESLACLPLVTKVARVGVLNLSFLSADEFDTPRRSDLALLGEVVSNVIQTFFISTTWRTRWAVTGASWRSGGGSRRPSRRARSGPGGSSTRSATRSSCTPMPKRVSLCLRMSTRPPVKGTATAGPSSGS